MSIFLAPPPDLPTYDSAIVVQVQPEAAIRAACGLAFGCISIMVDRENPRWPACIVRVWIGLPADLRATVEANLRAQWHRMETVNAS